MLLLSEATLLSFRKKNKINKTPMAYKKCSALLPISRLVKHNPVTSRAHSPPATQNCLLQCLLYGGEHIAGWFYGSV